VSSRPSSRILTIIAALAVFAAGALADDPNPKDWDGVLAEARGQTVYWNAWAGEPRINDYIAWAGREADARYGVEVVHVKLSDTAEAVSRVLAEKAAGTTAGGAVDLIWINGENFSSMKENGLLFGPWAEDLPNFRLTDPEHRDSVRKDFTVPVEGYEAPWGSAQLVFFYDTAKERMPPKSMPALLEWAKSHQGRFTYPRPPDFLGSTFLKQVLLDLVKDRAVLYRPADNSHFDAVTKPLWAYLDELNPTLWRGGRAFPAGGAELRRLLADDEISLAFSFDPAAASAAIANGELTDTVRSYVLDGGTIGNVHFLAIPFDAEHKAGAMVLANFLLSPEAQARKQDPRFWGSSTVLALDKLPSADRSLFAALELGIATPRPEELGIILPEPHPTWMKRIEQEWLRRYTPR